MVSDCNQSSFKSKKEQIFILCSNNGKREHSVALSQIMVKIKSNVLLFAMVVRNKKQVSTFIFFSRFLECSQTRLQTFHFTSEQAQPTVALPSVPDLRPPNLFAIPFFVVNCSLTLLSKQHRGTYYYVLLRTTTYYYVLLRTTTYYYVLLRTTTYYYVLLRTTTYYYVLLRTTSSK